MFTAGSGQDIPSLSHVLVTTQMRGVLVVVSFMGLRAFNACFHMSLIRMCYRVSVIPWGFSMGSEKTSKFN